jgi:hypothetical protein
MLDGKIVTAERIFANGREADDWLESELKKVRKLWHDNKGFGPQQEV